MSVKACQNTHFRDTDWCLLSALISWMSGNGPVCTQTAIASHFPDDSVMGKVYSKYSLFKSLIHVPVVL